MYLMCTRRHLCLVKVGLDFTPRWCSSEDEKTRQREVLRAQVYLLLTFIIIVYNVIISINYCWLVVF